MNDRALLSEIKQYLFNNHKHLPESVDIEENPYILSLEFEKRITEKLGNEFDKYFECVNPYIAWIGENVYLNDADARLLIKYYIGHDNLYNIIDSINYELRKDVKAQLILFINKLISHNKHIRGTREDGISHIRKWSLSLTIPMTDTNQPTTPVQPQEDIKQEPTQGGDFTTKIVKK